MTVLVDGGDGAFQYLRSFVQERSAIVVSEEKRYLVETRLGPVARQAGLAGLDELVRALRSGRDPALAETVVDAMTTNETSFFRDQATFEALQRHVLPERLEANRLRRQLSLWSAACSTGQEPYSLAMLLDDAFPELAGWQVDLFATDLSARALRRAEKASYSALEVNRGLPLRYLEAYFRPGPEGFQLVDRVRDRVRFGACNLAGPLPPLARQDVILLRNVLIYFDRPTRRRVLDAVVDQLRPGGYLVLGAAETSRAPAAGLRAITLSGATVYQREAI